MTNFYPSLSNIIRYYQILLSVIKIIKNYPCFWFDGVCQAATLLSGSLIAAKSYLLINSSAYSVCLKQQQIQVFTLVEDANIDLDWTNSFSIFYRTDWNNTLKCCMIYWKLKFQETVNIQVRSNNIMQLGIGQEWWLRLYWDNIQCIDIVGNKTKYIND